MNEREVFTEALLRPNEAERAAFLDAACGKDVALRRRVETLLARHADGHPLLDARPADLLGALADTSHPREAGPAGPTAAEPLAALLRPSPRPGALGRLGNYDVLEVLGQGGCGIVAKAFDDRLQRVVAIKVLAPHLAATSPPRQRFLREARAVAQVRHEHVVHIYAVEEQPIPYLVMEFVEGQSLQQRLDAAGPLAAAEVVRLGRQIALGLAAAHAKGLIHRDVKPANILLESEAGGPRAKLTDFGLARAADDASLTQSGVLAGTPMFMAPEQAGGEVLDARADLFSLGSVLYTMTAGRPPFRAPTPLGVLKRVAEDEPRPLREVIGDVPPGLVAVIARLHAKRPADRFATAQAAADALTRCLTGPAPPPARSRRRAAVVGAAILLAAAGLWVALSAAFPPRTDGLAKAGETPVPPPPPPGSIVVTSARDDGGVGTLRWAVSEANLRHGENTITFDPDAFAGPTTITLAQGPLVLIDPARTTIIGPAAGLTVSGDNKSQVFVIGASFERGPSPAQASIADLTITHGRGTDDLSLGGGVLVRGGATLTLTGCTLRDNAATHHNAGGGGVFCHDSTVILTNCTLTRNDGFGASGIKNFAGTAIVTNCTFVGNVGANIWTGGFNRAQTVVNNCLFAGYAGDYLAVADAVRVTGDYNLSAGGNSVGPHSTTTTEVRLGPLGRHGGPTETFPPLTGSPALNAGNNDLVPAGVRRDQRGLPRIRNGKVDVGAFEVQ